jgi:hypothetical protein
MKANLKKILGLAALGMTLLTTTVPMWAGDVYTPGVFVGNNQDWPFARGSMVGARYSADSTQYIGCFIDANSLSSINLSIRCFARDSAGHSAFCISFDPRHVAELQGMTDSSYIAFVANRANNLNCDSLTISNYSSQLK